MTTTPLLATGTPESLRTETGGSRQYRYPPTGDLFLSVTSVTEGTVAKPHFTAWGTKLAASYAGAALNDLVRLGAARKREVLAALEVEASGVMTKKAMLAQARAAGQQAVTDAIRSEGPRLADIKRAVGSHIHDVARALILWAASPEGHGAEVALPALPPELRGAYYDDEPVEDVADWMTAGFVNFVTDLRPVFLASEMVVYNPELRYAGTLDFMATILGRVMDAAGDLAAAPTGEWTACVDIKTGKHQGPQWQEQATAYRRCPEALVGLGELRPTPPTDGSAVLHLRPEYPRGYRFMPVSRGDDAQAWNRFRRALELVRGRQDAPSKPGRPAYPLNPDGTVPPRRLADLDGEGYGRAPTALHKAGVTDLADLAAHDEGSLLALKGVGAATVDGARRILAAHGLHLADTPTAVPVTAGVGV